MKLIAPTTLLIHWIGIFIYYSMCTYCPAHYNEYGWSVFYFSINNITIINYCLLFIFVNSEDVRHSAKQFAMVDIIFTLVLGFAVISEWSQLIKHTYGLYISILGMIISTILVVLNGIRYGYHKEYENE